jgi:hypothetical protein
MKCAIQQHRAKSMARPKKITAARSASGAGAMIGRNSHESKLSDKRIRMGHNTWRIDTLLWEELALFFMDPSF